MKTLLLCAGHNDLGLIRGLKKLGHEIIVTGSIPGLIGEKYCDKYIQADYSNKDLILKIAKEENVDRVCACCNDYGVYTAAYVAEHLNLPGYDSYRITCLLHNKDKFKAFAKEIGLISPWTEKFCNASDALAFLKSVDYPVIIKPTDCSAGNGITKIDSFDEAEEAITYAFDKTREGIVVVEQFVRGTQHGFCTFLVNKKVRAYVSNNEYQIKNPYRVEIDTFPADDEENAAKIIIPQIEKIAEICDLKDGIFHLQYITTEDGTPMIIEVMRRVIGNMYSVPADMLSGFPWDYWEARARVGLSCENFPTNNISQGFFAYKAILSDKNGIVKKIIIPDLYQKYLIGECILKKEGDRIEKCQSEPVGFLFFMFRSQEEMLRILVDEYRSDLVEIDLERN